MPVAVHSADFGWVHRLRLWWGISDYLPHKLPWGEIHPPQTLTPDTFVLRWLGARIPVQWQPSDPTLASFRDTDAPASALAQGICGRLGPKLPGSSWRPRYEDGRFLTFTGVWPGHPPDTAAKPDESMKTAFEADDRRQPLYRTTLATCCGPDLVRAQTCSQTQQAQHMAFH